MVDEPTRQDDTLTADAMRPASADDILGALNKIGSGENKPPTTPRARRGRPPGSPNRTAAQKLADLNPDAAKAAEQEAKRLAKKKRAEEIEQQIYGELMIGSFNIPASAIYNPGKEPTVAAKDTRFTDLGQQLVIPSGLARSIGKLASELEQTETGSKVSGITQNSNAGLIVAAGMTIFGTVQYARRLNDTMEKLNPILQARKEFLAQQQQQEQNGNGPSPTPRATQDSGSVA
jgi:hypothetical protein